MTSQAARRSALDSVLDGAIRCLDTRRNGQVRYPVAMNVREQLAERMAEAVVKRLVGRRLLEIRDESQVRQMIRRLLAENLQAEEKIEADARAVMMDHAKEIRDSASDYQRVFTLVKAKLARDRGFIL